MQGGDCLPAFVVFVSTATWLYRVLVCCLKNNFAVLFPAGGGGDFQRDPRGSQCLFPSPEGEEWRPPHSTDSQP